jgi:hypothetical protein
LLRSAEGKPSFASISPMAIDFCGNSKVAPESCLACVQLEHRRSTYKREYPARPGPTDNCRVGKSKKVVKRRGVGVLVCVRESCLKVQGSQGRLGQIWSWDRSGPGFW